MLVVGPGPPFPGPANISLFDSFLGVLQLKFGGVSQARDMWGCPPSGLTLASLHPSGPPTFLGGRSRTPKNWSKSYQTVAEVEHPQNWPKSKLAEVEGAGQTPNLGHRWLLPLSGGPPAGGCGGRQGRANKLVTSVLDAASHVLYGPVPGSRAVSRSSARASSNGRLMYASVAPVQGRKHPSQSAPRRWNPVASRPSPPRSSRAPAGCARCPRCWCGGWCARRRPVGGHIVVAGVVDCSQFWYRWAKSPKCRFPIRQRSSQSPPGLPSLTTPTVRSTRSMLEVML